MPKTLVRVSRLATDSPAVETESDRNRDLSPGWEAESGSRLSVCGAVSGSWVPGSFSRFSLDLPLDLPLDRSVVRAVESNLVSRISAGADHSGLSKKQWWACREARLSPAVEAKSTRETSSRRQRVKKSKKPPPVSPRDPLEVHRKWALQRTAGLETLQGDPLARVWSSGRPLERDPGAPQPDG